MRDREQEDWNSDDDSVSSDDGEMPFLQILKAIQFTRVVTFRLLAVAFQWSLNGKSTDL